MILFLMCLNIRKARKISVVDSQIMNDMCYSKLKNDNSNWLFLTQQILSYHQYLLLSYHLVSFNFEFFKLFRLNKKIFYSKIFNKKKFLKEKKKTTTFYSLLKRYMLFHRLQLQLELFQLFIFEYIFIKDGRHFSIVSIVDISPRGLYEAYNC